MGWPAASWVLICTGTKRAVIVSITWVSEYVTALKRWQPPQVGEKKSSNTSV